MAGLISPKPLSYLQQHAQYNPYARGISAYSETPPITAAPLAHPVPHQPVGQYLPNTSAVAPLGVHEEGRIHSLVIELLDPNTREGALLELSKKREQYEDLALVLWHSFGAHLLYGLRPSFHRRACSRHNACTSARNCICVSASLSA